MADRVRTKDLEVMLGLVLPRTAITRTDVALVVDDGRRPKATWWKDGPGWRCSAAIGRVLVTVDEINGVIANNWPLDGVSAQALVDEHEADQRREAEHLAELRAKLGTARSKEALPPDLHAMAAFLRQIVVPVGGVVKGPQDACIDLEGHFSTVLLYQVDGGWRADVLAHRSGVEGAAGVTIASQADLTKVVAGSVGWTVQLRRMAAEASAPTDEDRLREWIDWARTELGLESTEGWTDARLRAELHDLLAQLGGDHDG